MAELDRREFIERGFAALALVPLVGPALASLLAPEPRRDLETPDAVLKADARFVAAEDLGAGQLVELDGNGRVRKWRDVS